MVLTPKLNQILLIDDSFDDNYLHQRLLEQMDIAEKIAVAYDGQEALAYLSGTGNFSEQEPLHPQPDLIFLDINMPRMNGWEFLKFYRELPEDERGGVVIVMLTTSLNPDDRSKAKELDLISTFLPKPLTKEMVEKVLQENFSERLQ